MTTRTSHTLHALAGAALAAAWLLTLHAQLALLVRLAGGAG